MSIYSSSTLSPEELEKLRKDTSKGPTDSNGKNLRKPAQVGNYRPAANTEMPSAPESVKEDKRRREGPACGLTKRDLIVAIAAGESFSSIEKAWNMKYNTIHDWVKKWELKGLSQEKARKLLAEMGVDPDVKPDQKPTVGGVIIKPAVNGVGMSSLGPIKPVTVPMDFRPTPTIQPISIEQVQEKKETKSTIEKIISVSQIIESVLDLAEEVEHWKGKAMEAEAFACQEADKKQALLNQINQVAVERDALRMELDATKKAALDILVQVQQAASAFQVTQ